MRIKRKQASHDQYIQVLNAEIDKLNAENRQLRNEAALLNQSIETYKEMLVRIEDLKSLYQNEIKEVSELKDAYQQAIDDARSAERKYTEEFRAFLTEMKQ